MADSLTVQRLFADPPLTSPAPQRVRFSPNGRFVTYTRLSADDRERQDLWAYDCELGQARCLVDARDIADSGQLSQADKERLERQRQFVGGVIDYAWFPDGESILIPLQGCAFQFVLETESVRELASSASGKGEMRLSSTGRYLTYVLEGDLYVFDLTTEQTIQVTFDASDEITNGSADFIAQEEMHRFEGYWWSSNDDELVFTKVDTSPIPITHRQDINADGVTSVAQRYPYAGGPNAAVTLCSYAPAADQTRELSCPLGEEDYLARVGFVGDSLTVQIQDRAQQQLKVLARIDTDQWTTWVEESSDTWINLHDNIRHVAEQSFLWTSEAEGQAQLLFGTPGRLRAVSPESMHVNTVLASTQDTAFVNGWLESPTEQHLYAVPLTGGEPNKLTQMAGWHQCAVHVASGQFVTTSSNVNATPSLQLCSLASGDVIAVLHDDPINPEHPYAPFLPSHQIPTFGTLLAEDGAVLHYRLTKPTDLPEGQQAPVIVYVYGGPGAQHVRNEWPPLLLQLFAQNGFGVFQLDNRGTTNRGRHFEAPIYRSMGGAEVVDQVQGVAALGNYDWVDPDRIGVFGHSYGGYMTLMCLSKHSDVFRSGVAAAPVSDWRLYDTHYTERFMGDPERDAAAYDSSAVLPWLGGLDAPLLLMHGMADDNVLFTHSTMLMRELQRLNKKFELMTYPGSKHALQERDVSIHRFELILDFFRRTL